MLVPINNLLIEQTNIDVSEVLIHCYVFSILNLHHYYCTDEMETLSFDNNWQN